MPKRRLVVTIKVMSQEFKLLLAWSSSFSLPEFVSGFYKLKLELHAPMRKITAR
jgi:hypothetical protein